MIFTAEKIQGVLSRSDFPTVRAAFIARARLESGRIADTRQWMLDNGFELLDVPADRLLTDDGREILRAHGKAWALKPEVHAQRVAEAIEHARQRSEATPMSQQPATPPATCAVAPASRAQTFICSG